MPTTTGNSPHPITAAAAIDAVKVYREGDAGVKALAGVSVDLPSERFTAIIGPSGSGKSTLLHCMAGLDSLNDGRVFIGGRGLDELSDEQLTQPSTVPWSSLLVVLIVGVVAGMVAAWRPARRAARDAIATA